MKELQNPRGTISKIKSWANDLHFKVIKGENAVVAHSAASYELLQKNLTEVNIQFYTFTPPEQRTKRLILRGIDSKIYTVDEIQADLMEQCSDVLKVVQMTSSKGEKQPLDAYMVVFKWSANLSVLKKSLRYACDHQLNWQNYRKPSQFRGTQCFRCQRYGHISVNCQLIPRCVKCTLNHPRGECKKTESDKVKCANCSLEHPANYRGCSKLKRYRRDIETKKKQINQSSSFAPSSAVRPSHSFASALKQSWPSLRQSTHQRASQQNRAQNLNQQKGAQQHKGAQRQKGAQQQKGAQNQRKQQSQPTGAHDFTSEIQRLFGMDLGSAMKKINEFWVSYDQLKDIYICI